MTNEQEKFFNFFLEKVAGEKQEEAKLLLKECFDKQDSGNFSLSFLAVTVPKLIATVNPEYVKEVKDIVEKFVSQNKS